MAKLNSKEHKTVEEKILDIGDHFPEVRKTIETTNTTNKNVPVIEREEIRKLRDSKQKLMLDE